MEKETRIRSILKSCLYRILGTIVTILIVLIFTGSLPASLGVGMVELISKIMLYYFYERMWQKIKWGKEY